MNSKDERVLSNKIKSLHYSLIMLVALCCCIGFVLLYSAAQGHFAPWASKQFYIFLVAFPLMIIISLIDLKVIYDNAYILYVIGLILLVVAEVVGHIAMGAQRWLRVGFVNVQPSEIMKIFIILVLARYFHTLHSNEVEKAKFLTIPLLLLLIPAALILKQPNLGTATVTMIVGGTIFFAAGVKLWKFGLIGGSVLAASPVIWSMLHDYQKKRITTFLNPEADPLGAGYNVMQSKIAIGSGGLYGKGFLSGTQNQLSFLPEKQTDFIFTLLAEEFGFLGCLAMLIVFGFIITYGYYIALSCQHEFGRLVAIGIVTLFTVHIFINVAMISGVIPVVGMPLPFLSYGGSNLATMLLGFGVVLNVGVNNKKI
jgi:rod shape determining protein RodA